MISVLLTAFVALIHIYIVVLEMALWDKPAGRKAFRLTPEFATQTKTLAANQGLYNGFLAAGLIYGLWRDNAEFTVFFLICVIIAGVFGALTASRKILFIQALPAALALTALWSKI
ncbi:MAG: DUF1304 domain-containing protein [Asticcacaulis sp.]